MIMVDVTLNYRVLAIQLDLSWSRGVIGHVSTWPFVRRRPFPIDGHSELSLYLHRFPYGECDAMIMVDVTLNYR